MAMEKMGSVCKVYLRWISLVALVSLSDAAKVSEPIFILLGAFVVIVLVFILTDGLLIWAIKRKWKYFS